MWYYYLMYYLGKLRRKYFHQEPEDEREYESSRRSFTVDGATAVVIGTFVGGSYLSGFLQYIGVSASLNGIISAIPSLAGASQLFGAMFAQRIRHRKLLVCSFALIHRMLFTLMFALPLLIDNVMARTITVIVMFAMAHLIGAFISPAASNWIMSLTPHRLRGRYFSLRELIATVSYALSSLALGFILDFFQDRGMHLVSYFILAGMLLALTITNFIALSRVKEPVPEKVESHGISIIKALKMPFADPGFRGVIVATIIWQIAIQMSVPYIGLYIISDLNISYMYVSVMVFATGIFKAACMRFWGRLGDRRSWAFVFRYVCITIGINYLFYLFFVPSNAVWMYPLLSFVGSFGWAAAGIALLNMQFDYAPSEDRVVYVGSCNTIVGLIGFGSVFIGAFVMEFMTKNKLVIMNFLIRPQQLMMFISGILLLIGAFYIKVALENKKRVATERN